MVMVPRWCNEGTIIGPAPVRIRQPPNPNQFVFPDFQSHQMILVWPNVYTSVKEHPPLPAWVMMMYSSSHCSERHITINSRTTTTSSIALNSGAFVAGARHSPDLLLLIIYRRLAWACRGPKSLNLDLLGATTIPRWTRFRSSISYNCSTRCNFVFLFRTTHRAVIPHPLPMLIIALTAWMQ